MNEAPTPSNCPSVIGAKASAVCNECPNRDTCSSSFAKQSATDEMVTTIPLIKTNLSSIKHIILVISGKGGTGKSTVSTNLARALAADPDCQVGLLDLDICGPSIPRMFDLEGHLVHESSTGWDPVLASENLAVMSCGFLVESLDDAIIWRGPKKNTLIREFLTQINWGELDYLIIDTPPGTSDEHISVVNYIKKTELPNLEGALMVSTPQEVSLMDVRKQIDFCKRVGLKVLGIVENMARFKCPKCKKDSEIFRPTSGGVGKMAADFGLEIFGTLPLNPLVGKFCDFGQSMFEKLEEQVENDAGDNSSTNTPKQEQDLIMKDNLKSLVNEFILIKDKIIKSVEDNHNK